MHEQDSSLTQVLEYYEEKGICVSESDQPAFGVFGAGFMTLSSELFDEGKKE